jgi:hypothetical protein
MSTLCCEISELFQTDFGKLIALHFDECCILLHKYSAFRAFRSRGLLAYTTLLSFPNIKMTGV